MTTSLWIISIALAFTGKSALTLNVHSASSPGSPDGDLHVLLVAGSNGWWNYRHQADVAHAYQMFLRKGVSPDHIILMMYDDIANNPQNPYPGKLINQPNGTDVYKGIKIDYSGSSVNARNFLNVLEGNADKVRGGTGRVINSKPNDRIFVYFTDHGGVGIICFVDDVLTKRDLNNALKRMHKKKRYSQFVFYLESCESGSMFEKTLKPYMNVYAVTAANAVESSWATYCDFKDMPCLGDTFSVNWMRDSEEHNIDKEDLNTQYKDVRKMTNSSHVMYYGNLKLAKEPVGWFQGQHQNETYLEKNYWKDYKTVSWPARDVKLMHLRKLQKSAVKSLQAQALEQQIAQINEDRRNIETVLMKLVANLLPNASEKKDMFEQRNVVEDLICHDDVVKAFDMICIDVNRFDYALKYIYVLNNLCVKFGDSKKIIKAMRTTCSTTYNQFL